MDWIGSIRTAMAFIFAEIRVSLPRTHWRLLLLRSLKIHLFLSAIKPSIVPYMNRNHFTYFRYFMIAKR